VVEETVDRRAGKIGDCADWVEDDAMMMTRAVLEPPGEVQVSVDKS